jgi:hypothetical protein
VEISVDRGTNVQKIGHFCHLFPQLALKSIPATVASATVTPYNPAFSWEIALSHPSLPRKMKFPQFGISPL